MAKVDDPGIQPPGLANIPSVIDMTNPYVLRDLLYHGIKGWPLPQKYDRILARLRRD